MALSLCVFSSFLPTTKILFGQLSSSATVRLVPTNAGVSRSFTVSAAVKPATEAKKREPRGIMKPRRVSPDMQAFLGGLAEIPRTQALKEIWAYIKTHNLQDPADKKVIICDENLKRFSVEGNVLGFLRLLV